MRLPAILSDFTLGFSDGLTVPFALTAGLSSLGKTDTVIYAGLAELCAGCISMGIGGYLSARDANRQEDAETGEESVSEQEKGVLLDYVERHDDESSRSSFEQHTMETEEVVVNYLRPLNLPAATLQTVLDTLRRSPTGLNEASLKKISSAHGPKKEQKEASPLSPILSGLTISLGYICGGLIPLLPYCFSRSIGQGFRWSIAACLIALFGYGAVKEFALGGGSGSKSCRMWKAVREGIQMVLLGAMAAGAAVLCVSLVGG